MHYFNKITYFLIYRLDFSAEKSSEYNFVIRGGLVHAASLELLFKHFWAKFAPFVREFCRESVNVNLFLIKNLISCCNGGLQSRG